MKDFAFLLPARLKLPGKVCIVAGVVLSIVRFYYGIKPDFLNLKIFALYSSYLQSNFLEVTKNQMIEEFAGIFLLLGLFMVAFSKEKNENRRLNSFRLKSFFISSYLNTLFLLAAMILTFGFGFVYMMIINLVSWLLIYVVSFRVLVYMDPKKVIIR